MRHIFHEILARYLDGEQHAFEASPRELWPQPTAAWHPPAPQAAGTPVRARGRYHQAFSEFETQS